MVKIIIFYIIQFNSKFWKILQQPQNGYQFVIIIAILREKTEDEKVVSMQKGGVDNDVLSGLVSNVVGGVIK